MGDLTEKAQLRKSLIRRRDEIGLVDRIEKSNAICREAFEELQTGLAQGSLVGIYSALGSEVDLRVFETLAWNEGWSLAYPVMVRNAGEEAQHMEFYLVPQEKAAAKAVDFLARPARPIADSHESLADCRHVEPEQLDAFLVPLVAFDQDNTRMGYGGGNYDRYVPRLRDDAVVLGIAFEEQYEEDLPVEPHDCHMPLVITA